MGGERIPVHASTAASQSDRYRNPLWFSGIDYYFSDIQTFCTQRQEHLRYLCMTMDKCGNVNSIPIGIEKYPYQHAYHRRVNIML